MDEITSISILVLAVALCLPLFSGLFAKRPQLLHAGKIVIFLIYVAANLYETILFRTIRPSPILMSPFWSYRESFAMDGNGILHSLLTGNIRITNARLLKEIILNVLLYVPLGYLLPFVWPKLEKKRVIVLIGFLCSCATEATQYIFRLGWCELDDIIGNTFGCLIGCLIYKLILKKQLNSLKDPD